MQTHIHTSCSVNSTPCSLWPKILVFVLQMEKSKQSTWMRWSSIALLREGEGVTWPSRWGKGSQKKKAWWSLLAEREGEKGERDRMREREREKERERERERVLLFQVPLKPTLPHRKAGPEGMGSSQPCEGGLAHPQATYMSPKLFLFLPASYSPWKTIF
jgi:hypothetical protein